MTKVIVLGQQSSPEKKKIEFLYYHDRKTNQFIKTDVSAEGWGNVVLMCKSYLDGLDLMFCYENDNAIKVTDCMLYLGKFNDGVV